MTTAPTRIFRRLGNLESLLDVLYSQDVLVLGPKDLTEFVLNSLGGGLARFQVLYSHQCVDRGLDVALYSRPLAETQ